MKKQPARQSPLLHDYAPLVEAATRAGINRESLRRWLLMPDLLGPGKSIRTEQWAGGTVIRVADVLLAAESFRPKRGPKPVSVTPDG